MKILPHSTNEQKLAITSQLRGMLAQILAKDLNSFAQTKKLTQ